MEKIMKTHIFEIEELACKVTGLDYDAIDADEQIIDNALINELGIDTQQFQEIVERLLPLIMINKSDLTDKVYKGFADVDEGLWLVKTEI